LPKGCLTPTLGGRRVSSTQLDASKMLSLDGVFSERIGVFR